MNPPPRLPLARLLLIGIVVPAVFVAVDDWLLSQMRYTRPSDRGHTVLTMATFVLQMGIYGWLCGRLLEGPWRWGLFLWVWVLVDVQILAASVFANSGEYWDSGRMLAGSLFAAQVGLAIVWAVLGTTRWTIRLPISVIAATVLAIPLRRGQLSHDTFFIQAAALLALCLALRWQGFRVRQIHEPASDSRPDGALAHAAGERQSGQFNVRDLLLWTTSLAVVLAVLRALALLNWSEWLPEFRRDLVTPITLGVLAAGAFIIALWAAIGSGPALVRLVVLAISLAGLGFLAAAFSWYSRTWNTGGFRWWGPLESQYAWTVFLHYDGWLAMIVALPGSLLYASLVIVRTIGYRLVLGGGSLAKLA